MAKICYFTGKRPVRGNHIWRSGKAKKSGGIGTHITAITKRRFYPNLKRVRALVNGRVMRIRVATSAIKKGLVIKPFKRTWKKPEAPRPA
ncbi:MAG: 50S ribosomal protein L28 [Verrucomicrobia bacterium]|nr:50S ribosomal protein L28 [Verrucomicrobiota bacterium]